MHNDAHSHGGASGRLRFTAPQAEHRVQFYENDDFLIDVVAEHFASGLAIGDPAIAIATPEHLERLAAVLAGEFDVPAAIARGQLQLLDARETLDALLEDGAPSRERFDQVICPFFETARAHGGPDVVVRAFGEMVNLLWREGRSQQAVRLEELWNDFAERQRMALLCGYGIAGFGASQHGHGIAEICRHHTHVVPTERYVTAEPEARLREVALLQERALALEVELAARAELETRLRDLLAEREGLLEAERSARAEAEAASRAKSQFLAVMSHELRTPLNAIAGHVDLLQLGIHGELNPAQRESLERVTQGQRRLLGLVTDVLNLVRIESGRVEYALEDVDVRSLLDQVVPLMRPQVIGRGLHFSVAMPEERVVVRADREKLVQVLLNLLANAIKFTPAGGRVTLEVANLTRLPAVSLIRVHDTGIGIPVDRRRAIFEPFVQVHTGPTRSSEGAGLGLTISRDLTRGMGGDLRVRSLPGAGSTFTVALCRAGVTRG